ncbi:MAG: SH3 domain-containing protein [Candidatus Limiplasma sp.]|nr:SH3 domain-containing protein [Candidatus Limiplasma sp.]
MSIKISTFLRTVLEIYEEHPTYREGGLARDGTCDCVGMVIAAMTRAGHAAYALKSSNYFARRQIEDMICDLSESDVYLGMVVFKRRYEGDARYKLPVRDNVGGRYYNGDLTDYYHIGVVTGVDPLVITHCTSGNDVNGTTKDYELGSWSCGGKLKGVNYDDYTGEEESTMALTGKSCTVVGGALNLRASKNTTSNRVFQIPEGALVYCYEDDGTWSRIKYDASGKTYTGYAKSEFLSESDDQDGDTDTVESDVSTEASGTTITLTAAEVEAIKLMAAIAAKL